MSTKACAELIRPGATFLDPGNLDALTTTCGGGVSRGEYTGFNLGDHVGDNPVHVLNNRRALARQLGLADLRWVQQVHGTSCHYAAARIEHVQVVADALWTDQPNVGLCIMTADCLPIFIADDSARVVAMVHGGWRSLVGGILQKLKTVLAGKALSLRAWIGPGISFESYPVGIELRGKISSSYGEQVAASVCREHAGALHADLAALTAHCLEEAGIEYCGQSTACTYLDTRFYSHRRASTTEHTTGRMVSVIWVK